MFLITFCNRLKCRYFQFLELIDCLCVALYFTDARKKSKNLSFILKMLPQKNFFEFLLYTRFVARISLWKTIFIFQATRKSSSLHDYIINIHSFSANLKLYILQYTKVFPEVHDLPQVQMVVALFEKNYYGRKYQLYKA